MLHISIIEKNAEQSLNIIQKCKECIVDYFLQFKVFECYEDIKLDEDFLKKTEILIANVLDADSIEQIEQIQQIQPSMCTIFYSSNLSLATSLYEVKPTYFIYEKQLFTRLEKALNRCMEFVQDLTHQQLAIKYNSKINIISIEDIVLIERLNRRLRICTTEDEYSCYTSFDDMIELLKNFCFIRTHTSYLVHPDYIERYEQDHIILKNGEYIPISRKYKKDVKDILVNTIFYTNPLVPAQ